jgi:hypothetical protein
VLGQIRAVLTRKARDERAFLCQADLSYACGAAAVAATVF